MKYPVQLRWILVVLSIMVATTLIVTTIGLSGEESAQEPADSADNRCKVSRRLVRLLQKDGDHLHRFAEQVRWQACTLCHPRFYEPNHSLPVGIARFSAGNG